MKKKVFISYRFTGEDPAELKSLIPKIHDIIGQAGHSHYSTISESEQFESKKLNGKEIMQKAFSEIDSSDIVLFFVRKPEISQGMLIELGYSLARKKRLILAIQSGIKDSIFRRQIAEVIEFENFDELKRMLKEKLADSSS